MKHKIALWWTKRKLSVVTITGLILCVGLIAFSQYQSPKSLWEWMQLLIVPVVLAIGGFLLNYAASQTEKERAEKQYQIDQEIAKGRYLQEQAIAKDKQREELFQTYLDRMSELLLKEGLRNSQQDSEVRNIARVRTLTVLNQLDTSRKNHLFSFLREAKLVTSLPGESIVSLSQADMQSLNLKNVYAVGMDFSKTNLSKADLSEANLGLANFSGADLSGADLSRANLRLANLRGAIFYEANLTGANLDKANLSGASLFKTNSCGIFLFEAALNGADLSNADLSNADLSNADLSNAIFLEANLSNANLRFANLRLANLRKANLSNADLSEADLSEADLSEANLNGANLSGANLKNTNIQDALFVTEQQLSVKKVNRTTQPL